jgi:ComF family protein
MRRGFNQAALLVHQWKKLADLQGIAFDPNMICENRLYRCRHTASQTGLGKGRRAANLKNAFKVRNRQGMHDKCILLVDDVLTTGATVDACAKVLKGAGAGRIKVLTLARAV